MNTLLARATRRGANMSLKIDSAAGLKAASATAVPARASSSSVKLVAKPHAIVEIAQIAMHAAISFTRLPRSTSLATNTPAVA